MKSSSSSSADVAAWSGMDLTLTEGGGGAIQALLLAHNNDSKGMQVVRLRDDAIIVEM